MLQWLCPTRPTVVSRVWKSIRKKLSPSCRRTSPIDYAASSGHLQVVQWLHVHLSEGCTLRAMNNAAAIGNLELVQ